MRIQQRKRSIVWWIRPRGGPGRRLPLGLQQRKRSMAWWILTWLCFLCLQLAVGMLLELLCHRPTMLSHVINSGVIVGAYMLFLSPWITPGSFAPQRPEGDERAILIRERKKGAVLRRLDGDSLEGAD